MCWSHEHTTMDGMNRVLIWLPLPRWLRDVGWGVLLVPVMLLIATISSGGSAAKADCLRKAGPGNRPDVG